MKTTLVLGLITSSIIISSASAMEITNDAMTKKDTMMTSSAKDTMMMNVTKMTLMDIAKYRGYNWKMDRAKLANMLGIKNYRGTLKQNLIIRAYLISHDGMEKSAMMNDDMVKDTMVKKDDMMK